jgi:DNA-binding NarL/FixJ family response regulator
MTILIVDDNPRIRTHLKILLERHLSESDKIFECADGGEAIKMYDITDPDWVLMDVAMEPVNGLKATQAIIKSHPRAKIVIVTQYDDTEYREAARNSGACAYVLKENLLDIPGIIKSVF